MATAEVTRRSGQPPAGGRPQAETAAATQAFYRRPERLQVGDPAPDFELAQLDAGGQAGRVRLSAFRSDRPVVLFFGSYT